MYKLSSQMELRFYLPFNNVCQISVELEADSVVPYRMSPNLHKFLGLSVDGSYYCCYKVKEKLNKNTKNRVVKNDFADSCIFREMQII